MITPRQTDRDRLAAAPARVSSYTGGSGNCVAVARGGDLIGIHDTKAGRDIELVVSRASFASFVDYVAASY